MKAFKWTKFKILSLVLAASFIAIAAGGSIAFFTDSGETTSVFTAGNVYIELSEAAVVKDASGNMVADATKDRITGAVIDDSVPVTNNYGSVFPGQTITKDPTIKNIGDSSAWVAAKIIIKDGAQDVHKLFGYDGYDELDIERLLAGGLLYTGGVLFFKAGGKKKYFHSIFHLFVLLGSITHSLCILFFAM